MNIRFVKTHALGNDFILTEDDGQLPLNLPETAQRICHRQFGVGADGWITWTRQDQRFDLRIFNRDGSEAECSGNGLRCVAAHLIESGIWPESRILLRTISGDYALERLGSEYRAVMGMPRLKPSEIPMNIAEPVERVVDYPLVVGDQIVRVTACSTGNPHCSLFVDSLDPVHISAIGSALESHTAFPNRTNVEFVHVRNRNEIDVAFWERGVGETYASGTGSCGATVACVLNDRTDRKVTVHTRAGRLVVEWPADGPILLTSTARVVAEGSYFTESWS